MAAQTLGWDKPSPSGILAALIAASATGTGSTPATPPTPFLFGTSSDQVLKAKAGKART